MKTSLISGTPSAFRLFAWMLTAVIVPNIAASTTGPVVQPISGLQKQDETLDSKPSDAPTLIEYLHLSQILEQIEKGELANSLERWDTAINEFKLPAASDLLIEQEPSLYVRANVGLAVAWQGKGRPELALSILHDLTAKGSDLTIVHRLRADIYHSRGLFQAELAARYHSLSLKPDDIELQIDLGWMLATSPSPEVRDVEMAIQVAKGINGDNVTEENSPRLNEMLAAIVAADGNFDLAVNFQKSALEKENLADRKSAEARLAGYTKKIAYVEPDGASDFKPLASQAMKEKIRRSVVLIRLEGTASCVDQNGRPVTFTVEREQLAAVLSTTGEFLVSEEFLQTPNVPKSIADSSNRTAQSCNWVSNSPPDITAWQFDEHGEPKKLGDVAGRADDHFWNLAVIKLKSQKEIPIDGIPGLEAIRFVPELAQDSRSLNQMVWYYQDFNSLKLNSDVKTVQALELANWANRSKLPAGALLFDESGYCAAIVPWSSDHALVESQGKTGVSPEIRLANSITSTLASIQGLGVVPRFRIPVMFSVVPVEIPAHDGSEPDTQIGLRVYESDSLSLPDGIRSGDTIVQIDGRKIQCNEDIAQSLEFAAARNRNTITVTLTDSRIVELTAAKETQGR